VETYAGYVEEEGTTLWRAVVLAVGLLGSLPGTCGPVYMKCSDQGNPEGQKVHGHQ
jgi:hypothetical protein